MLRLSSDDVDDSVENGSGVVHAGRVQRSDRTPLPTCDIVAVTGSGRVAQVSRVQMGAKRRKTRRRQMNLTDSMTYI